MIATAEHRNSTRRGESRSCTQGALGTDRFGPQISALEDVEVYADLENLRHGLYCLGYGNVHYGWLVRQLVIEFSRRSGMELTTRSLLGQSPRPQLPFQVGSARCRAVWCVGSYPVNVHQDDANSARRRRGFLDALRLRHGFEVEAIPLSFGGYHLDEKVRKASVDPKERAWQVRQKQADMALGVCLMRRSRLSNPPSAAIVIGGDADFAPAIKEVAHTRPQIRMTVVATRKRLSGLYRRNGSARRWLSVPPIILDDVLEAAEPYVERVSMRRQKKVGSGVASRERSQR